MFLIDTNTISSMKYSCVEVERLGSGIIAFLGMGRSCGGRSVELKGP